jgi:HAD superfamily hydrolase (TIGR01548 family)
MNESAIKGYSLLADGVWERENPPPLPLETIEAVIFDIDGVLVEVTGSFREVISRTVQFFFNRIMQVPGEEVLVSPEETGLFKLAGNFNNDWDLANGAVAWGLMKLVSIEGAHGRSTSSLKSGFPTLAEFTGEIKKNGGGLSAALEIIRKRLGNCHFPEFAGLYRPELVKEIFMEHYAGPELCRRFYNFDAKHYQGPGLVEKERFLLDLSLVKELADREVSLGVLTGRIPEEADYLFASTGLAALLSRDFVVTDDGSLPPKPNPAGLRHLAGKMGFHKAVYVGDAPDDWTTVRAYNSQTGSDSRIACCIVQTGTISKKLMARFYEESKPDYIALEVNYFLKALTRDLRAVKKANKY